MWRIFINNSPHLLLNLQFNGNNTYKYGNQSLILNKGVNRYKEDRKNYKLCT
jgi:hypothetical protein